MNHWIEEIDGELNLILHFTGENIRLLKKHHALISRMVNIDFTSIFVEPPDV